MKLVRTPPFELLKVAELLRVPEGKDIEGNEIPNFRYPSDHLPVMGKFSVI